ncbi:MAG TPA: hypothetical protein VM261_16775 [Kofleriaceae bacterium]|nr:hypothetical protein [Kofleriaceae bacterium]
MVYRSLVVGLLGALVLLIAAPRREVRVVRESAAAVEVATPDEATVVDVSRRAAGADPMPLLGLRPGERIAAVDGVAGDSITLAARWAQAEPGRYLDVELAGGRRILVLVHP